MRITDIVVEAGVIDAIKAAQKDYTQGKKQGYDAVDRVLNPSRWGDSDSKNTDSLDVKGAVDRAAKGLRLYDAEQQALTAAAKQISAGKIQTNLDSGQLVKTLKMAAQGQPLNDSQRALLAQFSKEL